LVRHLLRARRFRRGRGGGSSGGEHDREGEGALHARDANTRAAYNPPVPADADMITLDGTVERIRFRNPDNDFTVAVFVVDGASQPAIAVGTLTGILDGQPLRLRGTWIEDKRFGRQFKID